MLQVEVNLVSVLISAVVMMAIGYFWYSMSMFGKLWKEAAGLSDEDMKKMSPVLPYIFSFAGMIVMAYVFALFLRMLNVSTIQAGVQVGFWVWLGFVAPATLIFYLFEGKPTKLLAINVGYLLTGLLVMGAILATWR